MVNSDKKFHLLVVCSGNTCRSPMAAAALSSMLPPHLGECVEVASAGACATDGQPVTPAAITALERVGVEPGRHVSRRLTGEMIERADLVLVMEPQHREAVLELAPDGQAAVHLLHAFAAGEPRAVETVRDPYGGSLELYEECLGRIRRHLERVVGHLEKWATEHRSPP